MQFVHIYKPYTAMGHSQNMLIDEYNGLLLGFCKGNPPVTFHEGPVMGKRFPVMALSCVCLGS